MKLHELQYTEGARRNRKRVGRGTSSGHGKTSGRGQKGAGARSGGGKKPGFEGGQTPLFMRLPKRGFTNFNRVEYAIVNVSLFNRFNDGDEIDLTKLVLLGLVNKEFDGLKVLGEGELTKKVSITATKFSKSALEKIEKCGAKAIFSK